VGIGKLYFEDQLLQQRYKMGLGELNEALARLENLPNYAEAKVRGIPELEAVSDTGSWEHVIERLIGVDAHSLTFGLEPSRAKPQRDQDPKRIREKGIIRKEFCIFNS
jgi:hypothetical protein